ncbi:MAG TPA: diacylglycerol kinase family protein [Vicinamibacterales bacterium]|nr:diacylglycerol kinase family protein [Vicinamibacterales bacterium]
MRICLYWNPTAGDGVPLDEITAAIARAGHEIKSVLKQKDDAKAALRMDVDLLVAAGGDGTVARAGRALAGSELPMAILPLGTANNIATSLGIADDPMTAIGDWRKQQVVRIDVGVVTDGDGEQLFIEGVGTGLLPRGITRGRNDRKDHPDSSAEVEWARDVFANALSDLHPRHSILRIDDEEVEGDYLLVEVLNIASVGPRLRLSAETTPADGFLSVVIASAADRDAIRAHLNQSSEQHDSHAWLKSWRATRVEVAGWHEYHVDDEVRSSTTGKLAIAIRPSSLPVLA